MQKDKSEQDETHSSSDLSFCILLSLFCIHI